jgi:hypothetical protein
VRVGGVGGVEGEWRKNETGSGTGPLNEKQAGAHPGGARVACRADQRLLWVFGSGPTMKLTFGKPANAAVWNTLFTTTA